MQEVLDRLSDHQIRALLLNGKVNGARPFLKNPRGMIYLREEAAKRGIYASKNEEERVMKSVILMMEDEGSTPKKRHAGATRKSVVRS